MKVEAQYEVPGDVFSVDFLSVFKGKKEWLGLLKLKDPGAVLELIAVMELDIVRGTKPR